MNFKITDQSVYEKLVGKNVLLMMKENLNLTEVKIVEIKQYRILVDNNFSLRWWLLLLIPFYNIVWFAIIYITQTNVFPQLKFNNRLWKQFTGKNW